MAVCQPASQREENSAAGGKCALSAKHITRNQRPEKARRKGCRCLSTKATLW